MISISRALGVPTGFNGGVVGNPETTVRGFALHHPLLKVDV